MSAKILIVDDNHEFRKMLRSYLESQKLGVEIFEADNGEMGVAKASFVRADIILMDISLPRVNGLAAAHQIKSDNPGCDIIILTMFDVEEFKKAAKKIEATAFIGKNEIYDELIPVIKRCLKDRENHQFKNKKVVADEK